MLQSSSTTKKKNTTTYAITKKKKASTKKTQSQSGESRKPFGAITSQAFSTALTKFTWPLPANQSILLSIQVAPLCQYAHVHRQARHVDFVVHHARVVRERAAAHGSMAYMIVLMVVVVVQGIVHRDV